MNDGQSCGFPVGGRYRSFVFGVVVAGASLLATPALSGPQGGVVRAGEVGIHSTGAHTRVTQGSERAIIDWRSFDLNAGESVRFEQPSSRSATLNRVGRGPASQINGRIDANGQVFIVNPAGVIFGRSASVNVSGLLATSANLDDRDFLQGRLDFSQPGQAGAEVRNQGRLSAADGGFIALVAPQVRNDGLIGARLGRVALASGERFTLDLSGDRLVQFALSDQQTQRLQNHGEINADGGSVILLSAASARRVVDDVVNLDGVVRADTVAQRDGRIILGAADSRARVGGTLQAAGGSIELRAAELDLDGATLDVSAADGGGTLHVGGGWQGGGEGPRAQRLSVSADTRLRADATAAGDGGEVVLWSDGTTGFGGAISARGGPQGGDGGRVEVSGKRLLDFAGTVDARAPAGRAGHLLLDPLDMDIRALDAGNISRILRTGMSVSLLAERDLSVNAAIDGRGNASGGALSLQAGRDLAINDFIVTNDGAIDLLAGNTVRFAAEKAVFAGGAPIRVDAGGLLSSGVLLTSGTLDLRSSAGPVHIDAPVDPSNGTLRVEAAADIQVNAPLGNLGSGADVRLSAGGDIVIGAPINGLDATRPGGQVALQAAGSVFVDDFIVTRDGAVDIIAGGQLRFAADKAIFAGSAPIDLVADGLLAAGATVSSGPVSLRSLAGSVELNAAVESANGDLHVIAANDIVVNAALVNLHSGSDIALQAGRDIAVQAPINGIGATTPGGRVTLDAVGDIRVDASVATADGEIAITAGGDYAQAATAVLSSGQAALAIRSGGTLRSGALSSQQRVALQSTAGDIVVGGLIPQDGGDLLIEAAGDVRIEQPIANLRAGSRVDIAAGGDLLVAAQIDGLGAVQAGEVQLQADGDVLLRDFIATTLAPIEVHAGRRLEIAADGGAYAESAAVVLRAVGELLQAGSVFSGLSLLLNSSTASVLLNSGLAPGGRVTVDAAQDLLVNAALTSLAGGESLQLVAGRDVVVNSPIDGRGGVAGGTLGISAGRNLDIAAPLLTNNAVIDLQASGSADFAASEGLFAGNAAIRAESLGDLTAGPVSTTGAVTLVSRDGTLRTTGDIAAGSLLLEAARDLRIGRPAVSSGSLTASAADDLVVAAPLQGSRVGLGAEGNIRVDQSVATADGEIAIAAGGDFTQAATAVLSSGQAPLGIRTGGTLHSGVLSSQQRVALQSTAGDIVVGGLIPQDGGDLLIEAAGDVRIEQPIANLRAGSRVDIAAGGDLLVAAQIDGLGAVQAGEVQLRADGDVLLRDFIATTVAPIEVNAGGRIEVASTGGAYAESAAVVLRAVGELLQAGPVFSGLSLLLNSSTASVLVNSGLAPAGRVTVDAAQDLLVNAALTSLAGGESLQLVAGRDVVVNSPIDGRGGVAGGTLGISAGRNLDIAAPLLTNNAVIDLQASGSADFAASEGLFAGNAAIRAESLGDLTAGPVSTTGAVTLVSRDGTLRTTGDIAAGSLLLEAARDLRIGRPAVSSGSLTASAADDLVVAAPIQGGRVGLDAEGSVDLGARVLAGGALSVSGGAILGSGGLYSEGSLSVSSATSYTAGTLSARSSLSVASGGSLTVTQGVGGLSGGVNYRAAGDLNLNAPIADLGGLASLSAGGDVRLDGRLDGLAGGVRIGAGGDILVNQDVVTDNSAIELSAGGTIVQRADGVDAFGAPQTVQLRAGNAPISGIAGATISLGSLVTSGAVSVTSTGGDILVDVPIYETTGFTRLSAAGDIRINQVIANATTGADLVLSAGGDIHIDAKVGPWDRSDATYPVAGRDALPGGSIEMTAAGDILIGAEIATFKDTLGGDVARLALTSSAGAVDFSGIDLRVMSDFGELAISSFADLANGPALADVNAVPTTGYYTQGLLSLESTGGDVVIDRLIPEETGSVMISAFDQVRVNQRIYTNDGDITILAGDGGIIQNRAADPNPDALTSTGFISDIDARFGDLHLQASGDILPSGLRTGSRLTIVSTAGVISGGRVDISRAGVDGAYPDTVELAGYTGIDGFYAGSMRHLRALSSIGSITSLSFGVPATLLLVAGLDILNPSNKLGSEARLYAGRDIDLGFVEVFDLEIATGRHFDLATTMSARRAQLAAGSDPFAGIAGTTIAGVPVPEWTGPDGPGNITIGSAPDDIVWVAGVGGFVASATGDITLPKTHVGYPTSLPIDRSDPLHTSQPFTLSAGGNVLAPQIETIGPVTVTSSDGDITIESTIGAHVSVEDPASEFWNAGDLGVASLLLRADSGNITMREARAVGDITIAAPNGQVIFGGDGSNGIEAKGDRSVTDSDGLVAVSDTIDTTEVPRLVEPASVAPAVAPGPTLAGPGAPALPGALPPLAPAGVSVAALSAAAVDLSLATPGANQVSASSPTGVDGGGPGAPGGIDVGSRPPPGGGGDDFGVSATSPTGVDGGGPGAPGGIDVGNRTAPAGGSDDFGEIFVADSSQAAGDTVDPVRVDTRRSDDDPVSAEDEGEPTQDADRLAQQSDDALDAIDVAAGGEAEQEPQQEGDGTLQKEALIAEAAEQDEEEEEEERRRREAADATATMVVFAGGRGDARERDFGFGLPYEDGRVRP